MPTVPAPRLRRLAEDLILAMGTPPDLAQIVTDILIEANLAGHDSHGVLRLPWYAQQVREGQLRPAERAQVLGVSGAAARVDGRFGWGMSAARLATETAIAVARTQGAAAATLVNTNHIGRVGAYVEQIALAGMVGLALCNASRNVAPFGGYVRLMGTNPFAMAAPGAPGAEPLLLDFATAGVAEGKLRVARARGEQVAPGLLRDSEGNPTQDPEDFYAGGALEAFGLHKGSGMSLMIELLARGLGGADPTVEGPRGFNGTLIMALNIPAFAPAEQFLGAAERLSQQVHSSPPLPGVERVLLPGEPERISRAQRMAAGVPIPEATWAELTQVASDLGVDAG